MNHLCKNTISKKPEANYFGELEISLQSSIVDPLEFTVEYDGEYGELGTELQEYLDNSLSCTDIKPENVGCNFDLEVIQQNHVTPASEVENDIYYYHTDHLGSSSWITYTDGSVTQHMQNLPFGEPFIDQRATSYDIRYKFTGKEMDTETGYQYFGARYYNSDLSVWLSVDPLSDKYPSNSPYMYTLGNPIILIDPDGMKVEIGGKNREEKKQIRQDLREAKRSDKEFRKQFRELRKSEETYVYNKVEGEGEGNTTTDGERIFINYSHSIEGKKSGNGKLTSLFHETEHAIQFEHGELGFVNTPIGWTPVFRDITDELKAFQAGSRAPGSIYKRDGKQTMAGEMKSIANDLNSVNAIEEKKQILLKYYGKDSGYENLSPFLINSSSSNRIQTNKYFVRTYKPR
jgi:RHS repeat-associated protein